MADHCGRSSVVNPGTKLWRPPVAVTQFWRPRSGFGARFRFCKTPQKMLQMLLLQKTGAKTAPLAQKLVYFDGRAPLRVPGLTSERRPTAGVVGHIAYIV